MSKILTLCGSLRSRSSTRFALDAASAGAVKMGAELNRFDFAEAKLPFFDGDESLNAPATVNFKAQVKAADALLIATPVYHDSYSGLLKNALDLLYDELNQKLVGLIAVGGGRTGQGQALEHLRAVLRETNCWALPQQVIVYTSKQVISEDGKILDDELAARLDRLGAELALRTRLMKAKKVPTTGT